MASVAAGRCREQGVRIREEVADLDLTLVGHLGRQQHRAARSLSASKDPDGQGNDPQRGPEKGEASVEGAEVDKGPFDGSRWPPPRLQWAICQGPKRLMVHQQDQDEIVTMEDPMLLSLSMEAADESVYGRRV